jgi:uncharacterized membrane protein
VRARQLVALLSLIGIFIALYLTLYKVGVIGQLTCSIGSCETVNTSRWATFLRLPVATWGLLSYVVLLGAALLGLQERWEDSRGVSLFLVAFSGWCVLFSGWLTYLELFVIHAICVWCVTSATILVMVLLASIADLRGRSTADDPAPDHA